MLAGLEVTRPEPQNQKSNGAKNCNMEFMPWFIPQKIMFETYYMIIISMY